MRPSGVVAEPGIACEGIRSLPEGNTAQPYNPAVVARQNRAMGHLDGQALGLRVTGVGSDDNSAPRDRCFPIGHYLRLY
jgi:hypothetical protein